jgi:hypothetical protein
VTYVTSETLRRWREFKGWDVPRMARCPLLHQLGSDLLLRSVCTAGQPAGS